MPLATTSLARDVAVVAMSLVMAAAAALAADQSPTSGGGSASADSGAASPKPIAQASQPSAATLDVLDHPDSFAAEISRKPGGDAFGESPGQGAVLVGCEVTLSQFAETEVIIRTIRPIFELPDGTRHDGQVHGFPGRWVVRVEAEPGYAVGRMAGKSGDRIDGFYLIFMRRHGDRLDAADQYPGRWIGARTAKPLVEVSDKQDRPAIGLGGRCAPDLNLNALSLIFDGR